MKGQIFNKDKKIQNLLDWDICKSHVRAKHIVESHKYDEYKKIYDDKMAREKLLKKAKNT